MISSKIEKTFYGLVLIANLYFIGYAGLMLYLLAGWPLDETYAFDAPEVLWIKIGLLRILKGFLYVVLVALVVYFINFLIFRFSNLGYRKIAFYLSIAIALNMILATLYGGIEFMIKKPFF